MNTSSRRFGFETLEARLSLDATSVFPPTVTVDEFDEDVFELPHRRGRFPVDLNVESAVTATPSSLITETARAELQVTGVVTGWVDTLIASATSSLRTASIADVSLDGWHTNASGSEAASTVTLAMRGWGIVQIEIAATVEVTWARTRDDPEGSRDVAVETVTTSGTTALTVMGIFDLQIVFDAERRTVTWDNFNNQHLVSTGRANIDTVERVYVAAEGMATSRTEQRRTLSEFGEVQSDSHEVAEATVSLDTVVTDATGMHTRLLARDEHVVGSIHATPSSYLDEEVQTAETTLDAIPRGAGSLGATVQANATVATETVPYAPPLPYCELRAERTRVSSWTGEKPATRTWLDQGAADLAVLLFTR